MPATSQDLWGLTFGKRWIDAEAMAAAVESQVEREDLDFRSRLLIRDSLEALAKHWGAVRFRTWLDNCRVRETLDQIGRSDLGPPGFHFLQERLMESLRPETILDFLQELGSNLSRPACINVGGSIALMMQEVLRRSTEDIDVVDEVPPEIRTEYELLDRLARRFGLQVTHFQSRYLPAGWEHRLHSLGKFDQLTVHLVDVYDIFVGKLFSAREKDLDDLRHLRGELDKERIVRRIADSAQLLLAEPNLATDAIRNWKILYSEALPAHS